MEKFTKEDLEKFKSVQKEGVSPLSRKIWKDSGLDVKTYIAIYDTLVKEENRRNYDL